MSSKPIVVRVGSSSPVARYSYTPAMSSLVPPCEPMRVTSERMRALVEIVASSRPMPTCTTMPPRRTVSIASAVVVPKPA